MRTALATDRALLASIIEAYGAIDKPTIAAAIDGAADDEMLAPHDAHALHVLLNTLPLDLLLHKEA